ncbi:MAG TPA: hypothetical protein VHU44_12905 [Acidobacteriaceae bacterium]|jgi:cation transport ATPase|nr:hypothetical protein [Acidobacteriaceae bacterium]
MSVEVIKPIALTLCLTSLCAVFRVAFLSADLDVEQTCWQTLILLSLSAGISVSSGMLFRPEGESRLIDCMRTLPMQIFFWATGTMVVMFLAARYLETHYILLRDLRRL